MGDEALIEEINGHKYKVTKVSGQVVRLVACDEAVLDESLAAEEKSELAALLEQKAAEVTQSQLFRLLQLLVKAGRLR